MEQPFTKLESRAAFSGRIFSVHVDRVRLPHGRTLDLEVVRHPRSVVLLPVTATGGIVLVQQYRYAVNRWLWELPAGSLDPGEEPEAAARRECHEEIGKVAARATLLGSFFPTPGFCDEEMLFYRLDGLSEPTAAAALDEDELLEPAEFTELKIRTMVKAGEISDMKTVVGLTLLTQGIGK
jgi:ADP-ribose pyrophosphatase